MKTAVISYPRVGALRELKFATEKYFAGKLDQAGLQKVATDLRKSHWQTQADKGIDFLSSNDFSFYDNVLDTAVLLNVVPKRYRDLGLDALDEYFAMARGYQGEKGDVKALSMKKWFNTNYHYLVPEIDDETEIRLAGTKPFDEYLEAKALNIQTKPALTGPFTFLKLARFTGEKNAKDVLEAVVHAYKAILEKFAELGAEWVQFDEPSLVTDLDKDDVALFQALYAPILAAKGAVKLLLQTYFGDVRDCYPQLTALPFDGLGLDFVEGRENLKLINEQGFPKDTVLFAGLINGKNIWRNKYQETRKILESLQKRADKIVLSTSCSLLHVPYTVRSEAALAESYTKYFAFAEEKLEELADLKRIVASETQEEQEEYRANLALFEGRRVETNGVLAREIEAISRQDIVRKPAFAEREKVQKEAFQLPLLPTTTIGSFPQTADVKANRADFKKGKISEEAYDAFNYQKIAECIALQEAIGLDVLVHGEFERGDMVEYFGVCLDGSPSTEKAWVQSYGTRCVKPPIIWGDVSRPEPITVRYSVYAQKLTAKPVKGMLTGPVTILNWSFPREDLSLKECAYQIALAIEAEVLDLEYHGIKMIQIDEAALREKLPIRKSDWHKDYLDWAIPAFRLVHRKVAPDTQIHTHMCYSEFDDIIREIDAMDADVITFEASRSDLHLVDTLKRVGFRTEVGPGVYDIHSPRVPSVDEIRAVIEKLLEKISVEKLWINPDCGLKTRGPVETEASLRNMVEAVRQVRASSEAVRQSSEATRQSREVARHAPSKSGGVS